MYLSPPYVDDNKMTGGQRTDVGLHEAKAIVVDSWRPLSYKLYGVSLAGVSSRRRWPPPTTLGGVA